MNVGTPRFYVDNTQFMLQSGAIDPSQITLKGENEKGLKLADLNPANYIIRENSGSNDFEIYQVPTGTTDDTGEVHNINYVAVLGHNLTNCMSRLNFESMGNWGDGNTPKYFHSTTSIINQPESTAEHPDYNGFSIGLVNQAPTEDKTHWFRVIMKDISIGGSPVNWQDNLKVGAISVGHYFDMPSSPNMKLTMSIDYGVDSKETTGGAILSNKRWTKAPDWLTPAWMLTSNDEYGIAHSETGNFDSYHSGQFKDSRTGRRSWNLSFSFMEDDDVFSPNLMPNINGINSGDFTDHEADVADNGVTFRNQASFYSQVLHKTMFGHIPFIFQPDNANNSPSGFALCKLDMKKFKIKQVSHKVYSMNLKIKEVF